MMLKIGSNTDPAYNAKMLRRANHILTEYMSGNANNPRAIEILCGLNVGPYVLALVAETIETLVEHQRKLEILKDAFVSLASVKEESDDAPVRKN